MGNANETGFLSDGNVDDAKSNNNPDATIHLADEPQDGKQSIFMSQYAMNLYGVTNANEFERNALQKVPEAHRVNKISELFKYKKKLGAGASARVLLVQSRRTKRVCALKEISRKFKVHAQMFLRETVILESLKNEHILEIFDIFIDRKAYYICTAYYSGGEFFDRIIKMKKFSERQALKHIVSIIRAVQFMHSQLIVHRDLKPSNMVFDKKGSHGKLKLIDFGTSEIVIDEDVYPFERVGTILFCAPEWNRDRTGLEMKKSDMWAVGVICYILMVGRLPFGEWKDIASFNGRLWFPPKLQNKLSQECKDFLHALLNTNVRQRLSADQALQHPWVAGHSKAVDADLGLDVLKNIDTMYQVNKVKRIIAKGNLDEITNEDRNALLKNIQTEADVMSFLQEAYGDPNARQQNRNFQNIMKAKSDNSSNLNQKQQNMFDKRAKEVLQSIQSFKLDTDNNTNHAAAPARTTRSTIALADINEDCETDHQNQNNNQMQPNQVSMQAQAQGSQAQQRQNKVKITDVSTLANMTYQNSFVQEDQQEYQFDHTLVERLMELGLASKNACLRAVIAVEAKNIEAAADWLLQHGEDAGIDEPVDVV